MKEEKIILALLVVSLVATGFIIYFLLTGGVQGVPGPIGHQGETGETGLQGPAGENGISINWKGTRAFPPTSPQTNWAYFDNTDNIAYIWDGDSWEILSISGEGIPGPQGPQGENGENGVGITWKGSLASAPASPQTNWAYFNTADNIAYIWDGDSWEILSISGDGIPGPAGAQGPPGYGFATLVVAASDSFDHENADFICEGIDDQDTINNAINSLPTGGGSIYLREGTYTLSGNIIISMSNVALIGTGSSTALKIRDFHDADILVIYASGKANLLIQNLRIDGNKTNQEDGDMQGIGFINVENSKIVDCWMENLKTAGVYLNNSANNIVTGSTCLGNSHAGIWLLYSNNNIVTGNSCQRSDTESVCLYFSDNNTIIGNTIYGNSGYGIHLDSSNNDTVNGNTTQGNGRDGIVLTYSSNNTVTGNTIVSNNKSGSTYCGISVMANSDYNNIQGNTVRGGGTQRYGISIGPLTSEGNLVINNDLYQAGVTANLSDAGTGTLINSNRGNVGDYQTTTDAWAAYTGPTGTPADGTRVIIYSSGSLGCRLYCYSNGAWHYTNLT